MTFSVLWLFFTVPWIFLQCVRALTTLFGNGAHGIGKISAILTKIGKFDIILMSDVSIARLIPIISAL